jgi:hypothetical protein
VRFLMTLSICLLLLEKLTHQSSQVAPFPPLPKGNILQQQQQQHPPELLSHNPILDSSKGIMTSGQQQRSYSLCHHAPYTYCSRKTHHPSSSLAHHFTSHNCLRMVFSEFLVLSQDTMDWSSWVYRSNDPLLQNPHTHCAIHSVYV